MSEPRQPAGGAAVTNANSPPNHLDLFVFSEHTPPLSPAMVLDNSRNAAGCFQIYRVRWLESLLAWDGRRMLCHFRSPDAGSLRAALLETAGREPSIWAGEVIGSAAGVTEANVVVERHFNAPVDFQAIARQEDEQRLCLQVRKVNYQRTFLSRDHRHMACLYDAPDAESVRQAQHQARMPVERVWACQRLGPWMLDTVD